MMFRLSARAAAFTIIAMTMSSSVPLMAQGRGGGMAPAAPVDPRDLSGFWELSAEWKSVPPADLLPGITRATLQKVHDADLISERWCRPIGMPALMDSGRPLGFLQGSYELLITAEANTAPRHLYFRPAHISAEIFDPTSIGDSIAHWEGDTLVVDTIGFHAKNGRMEIPGGGFRTEKSHLVEQFKILKNGMLSVTSTWTDPTVFRTAHTYEYRYSRYPDTNYEPHAAIGCDPWDEERATFIERNFSPALKAAAEAALVKPGTMVVKTPASPTKK
jgi:hypothetical protein